MKREQERLIWTGENIKKPRHVFIIMPDCVADTSKLENAGISRQVARIRNKSWTNTKEKWTWNSRCWLEKAIFHRGRGNPKWEALGWATVQWHLQPTRSSTLGIIWLHTPESNFGFQFLKSHPSVKATRRLIIVWLIGLPLQIRSKKGSFFCWFL